MQRNRTWFQTAFIVCGVCGILLNFGFDYLAYIGNRSADESGRRVVEAYESILHGQHPEKEIPDSEVLRRRLSRDLIGNQRVERTLFGALVLDGAMIAMLFAFFMAEVRARRRVEGNLLSSLNYLRETNLALQTELVRRQVSVKTTVHDLKNPLGSIRGFAELISSEVGALQSVQEFSETIRKISQNSLDLVDSLLDVETEGAPKMAGVDLVAVLDEIVTQNEVQAQAKRQTLRRDFALPRAEIRANRMKIEELFSNLLSNAIKYSPLDSEIRVVCAPAPGGFEILVEDQGPGFSEEDRARAFQCGQTLSARPTGGETSTGFGLFIARQIVDLHGGEIEIRTGGGGRGAGVAVFLPALGAAATREPEPSPSL